MNEATPPSLAPSLALSLAPSLALSLAPSLAPSLALEAVPASPLFRRLASVRGIASDLRYAGSANFAGRVLYAGLDCAWLRCEAAAGLQAAARWLARTGAQSPQAGPRWTLTVLDALRPQRVQEAIWRDVAGTGQALYFAEPVRGSIHSFGMAVDVTLVDADGAEADMGGGFDEMTLRSHPALHAEHLAQGVLRPEHVARRELLAAAMAAGGFAGIATEWWHFDHGDRQQVRGRFPRVL